MKEEEKEEKEKEKKEEKKKAPSSSKNGSNKKRSSNPPPAAKGNASLINSTAVNKVLEPPKPLLAELTPEAPPMEVTALMQGEIEQVFDFSLFYSSGEKA